MENFIGIYENAFSKEFCNTTINYFNAMQNAGFTKNRQQTQKGILKIEKDDDSFYGHAVESMNFNNSGLMQEFNDVFWKIYTEQYANEFSVLNNSEKHNNYSFKIQKTKIGGGYHVWHYESCARHNCHRLLVWTVYLNDVEEGGETEFLYLHKRIKAKQGTLCIFPAAFTHTHRGNPPISNEKYIVTGWTEF